MTLFPTPPQPETPKEGKSMKIIRLAAENVKRLVAVEITPKGNVIEISGRNGAGKTSVLDAIWWALAGNRTHQPVPVRKGQTEAVISLDLGDIRVRREFSVREPQEGEEAGPTQTITRLFVESAEGARYPSPQKMLDRLVDTLTFDPLAFSRMPPKEKLKVLRGFVKDVDFEAEATANQFEYQQRRDQNRIAKDSRTRMAGIRVPEVEGDAPSVEGAQKALKDAHDHNAAMTYRAHAIQRAEERVRVAVRRVEEAEERVLAAQVQLKAAQVDRTEMAKELAALPKPEESLDETALSMALSRAQEHAEALRAREAVVVQRNAEETRVKAAEAASEQLTAAMAARAARLAKAVADADMPVPGLTLTPEGVMLEGIPLEQASDAEQLRLSCAIAMAQHAKLRVIRVRDGSLLDEDSMAILREMAKEHDYQVWIELVDTSGKVGVVIEDGRVAAAPAKEAE